MSSFYIVEVDNLTGIKSVLNSSNESLTASNSFIGIPENVSGYASIIVSVFADSDSVIDGFKIQFSSDGVNWDIEKSFTILASVTKIVQFNVQASYFRISYVNGITDQNNFRLETIFNPIRGVAETGTIAATTAKILDYDTSLNTDLVPATGILLPSSTGAVIGGTLTNPIRTDPIGNTAQPITDNNSSITVDSLQLPSSLINNRLDTNIGAWLGSMAPTIGQKTAAVSIPVVIATDQTSIPISNEVTDNILSEIAAKTTKIQKRYDMSDANSIYIGVSALGSLPDTLTWVIKKLSLDIDGNPTHSQWSENNVKWDDRASLTYS